MNLTLASIILASPGGFVRANELPAIIEADRLCWLLVRCGGCRFACPAQDVTRLMDYVAKGEDYVRDVSFPTYVLEEARDFIAKNHPLPERARRRLQATVTKLRNEEGRDWICTGNFDGNTCDTDADSGL